MNHIHLLSDDIIAHIAAGEVIERPAYIVKELIENAIDAGATRISIELLDSGCESIIVSDDGSGMSPDDMGMAFRLHSTSKIYSIDDLHTVRSLGFRGEALASIAAIATLTIQSKTAKDAIGNEIIIRDQKESTLHPIGMPTGTRIVVDDIFASTPVRKKFLASKRRELRLTMQLISSVALTRPTVHFIVKNDRKRIADFPVLSQSERIAQMVGDDAFAQFVAIKHQESYVTIHGWIGHPAQAHAHPDQWVIVNSRVIQDALIKEAVRDAVREYVPSNTQLPYVLFFEIPAELVDINVHPRKETVRFASPESVFSAVRTAVTDVFTTTDLTFESSLRTPVVHGPLTRSSLGRVLHDHVIATEVKDSFAGYSQFHATYIIAETPTGLLLIDQHAAHERILYEKFTEAFDHLKEKKESVQGEWTLTLTQNENALLSEFRGVFEHLGFVFTKDNSLSAIPALFIDRDLTQIIRDVLADLATSPSIEREDRLTHRLLATLACKSAVKAGDLLSVSTMREIVTTLQKTAHKYTCPHGRPTMISVPLSNLESLFGRR